MQLVTEPRNILYFPTQLPLCVPFAKYRASTTNVVNVLSRVNKDIKPSQAMFHV